MIKLKNITKVFDRPVLNKIDLNLEEGKIYVIKGVSGSGKTSLFNILTFLDTKYSGDYFWNGKKVDSMSAEELEQVKNDISYVFQKSYLFVGLTIRENLLFIKDDDNLIIEYSKRFNIENLLDKKPDELSGGERQRVSLVRALMLDAKVIVLDEPTSSLDKKNAEIFANYLKEIVSENKIIVISTHKDIYDDFANVVYNLEYGNLKKVKDIPSNKTKNEIFKTDKDNLSSFKYDFLFVKRRKKKRIVLSLLMIVFFLLTFTSISIYKNIKREIVSKYSERYPLQVFSLSEYNSKRVDQNIEKIYYNYKLECDNYSAYILLDEEDSILKDKDILKYGYFPNNDNEVLVNEEFIINNLDYDDYEQVLNTVIIIENEKFTISGIIVNHSPGPYLSNYFYREISATNKNYITPSIFIPYKKMKKIGHIDYNEKDVIITIPKSDALDIYINENEFTNTNGDFSYSLTWGNDIRNEYSSIYNYVKIGLLIGLLMAIFIFIFMISKISLELYYKKKEIGYLQLYRLSKDRIHMIFLMDYLSEPILSLIISIILFNIVCSIIYIIYRLNFFISFFYWILFIIVSFIYFYALVTIPVMLYLRKDILECIKEK